ncbi:RagB/SusD family nutrient uptake outer membrane protein [Niabella beijingensis]|uniref:RagB/SusD family nutrient uptake outer membrane protein n=1 Tax=Niabella beijingensis TaxID=2872700 RepID=UPI001CBEA3DB|nr:RagB/SusD family nutrient uptake outer membrane protein [Niabella beijingensis]MBZ4192140.1 RagB/SusD family nutrient uptake outer membrane protein [Niabella beijingensis]
MKALINKTVSLLLIILLFGSCVKQVLDKKPVSSFPGEDFYKTPDDAQAGVNGIYNAAQGVFRINFAYWGEARADNVQTAQSGESLTLTQNNLTESAVSANWTGLYTMISRANYAIAYIPNAYPGDPDGGKQLMGQARALRALAYFYLVRVWGDVPLVTEPYTSIEQDIFVSKTNKEQVLDQIETDLGYAVQNCADRFNNNDDRIKFTKGGAYALLAQVYMWRKKYAEAATASKMVLDNSLYTLAASMDDWGKIFTNSYSSESIFEIGYNETQTNSLRVLYAVGSDAMFTPSAKFRSSYEQGDKRIPYVYDTTVATPKAIWKFLGKGVSDEDPSPSRQNIVLIRLADILLLRAEALARTGGTNIAESLSLLNRIRQRAGLPAFETEAAAAARYGDLESAILHERSIELCFEGHRWFDLVRTGKAITTMRPVNGLSDERNLVWPVFVSVLNKNPNLEQSEFYK